MSKMPVGPIEWILLGSLLIIVAIVLILVALTFRKSSYQKIKIPQKLSPIGFKFKIQQVATILTHDGLFPSITLYDKHFNYRLLTGHKVEYKDITSMKIKKYVLYRHTIVLKIKGNVWGFYPRDLWISLGREDNLKELAKFFKEKGIKEE